MDPFTIALGIGALFKGGATLAQGYMNAKANAASAVGAEIEQKMAKLRGTQIAERSREELAVALGNIDAIQSARGVNVNSATNEAIRKRTMKDAYRDEAVARLGEMNRAEAAGAAARGYRTAAKWAMPIAAMQAAGSFAQGGSYLNAAGGG
ncbi:hypothetical protein IWC96_14405 [Brevundimonas sp. BAL450]|uniref:hypothetical protein n=1 Tax=Brevundimonas sp. BAL450 TaxID=1708162 RepID=UPI0018CB02E3|nr:hypothetical protein [Brevundimonas sp. BAL450]MBG7616466.1 hypothetical protein [Brevundimonas sp. BAL450]